MNESAVNAVLSEFKDPETGRSIVELGQVRDMRLQSDRLSLTLALTTHSAPLWKVTRADLIELLQSRFPELKQVEIALAVHNRPPQKLGQIGLTAKSVIAVGSGKGGVGKSTIAACLALGLKRAGAEVGLMDADVYGPSIPHLLGVNRKPEVNEGRIQPIVVDGLRVMSMGFLMPPGEAVIWRGPMLHGAITQFLRDTAWGDLDYLVIDMPPGTGDIALTLSQLLPLTGAVVVCTPQDVALLDAVKAIAMFRKVNIPVLGMVENMSYFLCPTCNTRYDIFGSGGAKKKAADLDIPFLGEVPINISIRVQGDEGQTMRNFDDPAVAPFLESICFRLVKNLADQHKRQPPLPTLPVL
ncbi:MAG TPA: Mrp/NBP35 family ATP-binding protein [Pirellulales bacterium]|nr:Mrp/NBP35 family ATP-binding protein [Pirellulales bacterium]